MSKAKYKQGATISSMRTFETSNADYFKFDGRTVSRTYLENMTYKQLKALVYDGRIFTAKAI